MEAQLLYFTCAPHFDQWRFKAVPISKTYLDSIPPASPPNLSGLNGLIDAIGKLCANGGEMAGWYKSLCLKSLVLVSDYVCY